MSHLEQQSTIAGGFVVGGDPLSELEELRSVLRMVDPVQRATALRERTQRAQADAGNFAEREVSALIADR